VPRKTIRVALVGVGGIAQITHLPALKRIPGAEIVALCDVDEEKAGRVAQRFGVGQISEDINDLLADESIDAFVVCTPNYLHAPISIAALEAGKHVLCERPMARNAAEAAKMVEAAKGSDRILMCAMNHRFRADSQILKKFVAQRELGSVFFGKAGWLREQKEWVAKERREQMKLSGGGVLMDLGVQMLDLALWILGAPAVEAVTASAHRRRPDEVEDAMSAFLRLDGGGALTLEVSWGLLMERDFAYCNLIGENGAALWNPLRIHKAMHGSLVNVTPEMDSPRNVYKQSIENELGHFLDCVRTGKTPTANGEEMVTLMQLVDAIYRSAKEGREVKLA
jgi:predicted dehydrogenase